ncbi:unnamed protein product [Sphagnum balticum]
MSTMKQQSDDAYTFKAAPVETSTKEFQSIPLANVASTDVKMESRRKRKACELQFETGETNHELVDTRLPYRHGFINAILTAYNEHLPFILSPDDMWLTFDLTELRAFVDNYPLFSPIPQLLIALQIGDFLGNNKEMAEKYRHTFVEHEGKKELIIVVKPEWPSLDALIQDKTLWPFYVTKTCDLIATNTKTDVSQLMTAPFSTTGPVHTQTIDKYIPVYSSHSHPICRTYLKRVEGHMTKIVESKKGNLDVDWWQRMVSWYQPEFRGSGATGPIFDGWIFDFMWKHKGGQYGDVNKTNNMAMTKTPFKLVDLAYTGREYKMTLSAGFVGVSQHATTKAVRPAIGWIVYMGQEDDTSDKKNEFEFE